VDLSDKKAIEQFDSYKIIQPAKFVPWIFVRLGGDPLKIHNEILSQSWRVAMGLGSPFIDILV